VLDEVYHWPIVAGEINGKPVRLLVDTGAGTTVVSAELLGAEDGTGVVLASLCIEDLCLQQTPAWAADNQIVRARPNPELPEVHALLGANVLRHARLELNQGRSVGLAFTGESCPGRSEPFRQDEWGRPFMSVSVDGQPVEDVLLDSGARYSLLDQPAVDLIDSYLEELAQPATSCAVTGCKELSLSQLRELCAGALCVSDTPVKYPSWNALGASFFAQGHFVIDGPAQRLVSCESTARR
jgi:hypothetical protein